MSRRRDTRQAGGLVAGHKWLCFVTSLTGTHVVRMDNTLVMYALLVGNCLSVGYRGRGVGESYGSCVIFEILLK